MVDQERLDRLLDRVATDLKVLDGHRASEGELIADPTRLAAVKYIFITAIEGCARIAHHIIAAEGWSVAESNAEAVRRLGEHRVLPVQIADAVARAVGFHNVLVHEYVEVDDAQVCDNLERLADLWAFVSHVATWSGD